MEIAVHQFDSRSIAVDRMHESGDRLQPRFLCGVKPPMAGDHIAGVSFLSAAQNGQYFGIQHRILSMYHIGAAMPLSTG